MTLTAASGLAIFIGTYTPKDGESRGIYAVQLDPATGALSAPVLAAETPQPTFLAWSPDRRTLFALGEGVGPNGQVSGGAAAFRFDPATRALAPLNARGAGGAGTTHLAADATGRVLVTASYSGGQVASFPIGPDGRLGPRAAWLAPTGELGPNRQRQDKPHPHSVTLSPDNRFAYVCDLGLDRVFRYRVDPATAALTPAGETATTPGAGPRHAKFSADGKFLYVINELDSTIATYGAEADGSLAGRQAISTLPEGFSGANICAEIRLSPDGRFVYGSNRGHDSIAVFARDARAGTLTLVEIVPCGGRHPRNFNLSPDGRWLVCANRDTNNLVVYRVDPGTGRLSSTGHTAAVFQPVCVLFVE
ncbi:MAG TPA: lactonase family protein [Opitutaceae bacterium]|nr:lactonase family protein [Opitutaceae bacterium]